ncbi:MAG: PIG-L family deacetylase [Gemmatimonadota bacterium]
MAFQDDPWSEGIVGTGLLLRRLDGVKRVLMIGAHPDDEDTALLAALSRGMGVETAYLSLTRGEGGQNLIGPEMNEGLGLVRTGELLAARALDGGRQYFTRAFDFGFSKTAEETFRFWPREEVLGDVTWIVRTFRPQVIVSVFSGTPQDGHGHHQVAGILAHEVFEVAGDPSRYPEQIAAGAPAWAPQKLYRLTRRNPQEGTAGVETGTLDPLLGRSYFQVAMESRSQHRSQDMGVAQPMGPRRSTVALMESRVPAEGADEIFAGVDTALVSLARSLPEGTRVTVVERLREYREGIREAKDALHVADPWASAPFLGEALASLKAALEVLETGEGSARNSELARLLRERAPMVQEAFLRAAGVVAEVTVEKDLLTPGQAVGGVVEVWNGGPLTLRGVTGRLSVPSGWRVEGEVGDVRALAPGALGRWGFQLSMPDDTELSTLYYLRQPRDGELYRRPPAMELLGLPVNPETVYGSVSFEVDAMGRMEVWRPARFKGVDKAMGEFEEPVQVVPAISVSIDPPVLAWPSGSRGSREFQVTVRSQSVHPPNGMVRLRLPADWQVSPTEYPLALSGAGAEASFTFVVTRADGVTDGRYPVFAQVTAEDGRVFQGGVELVDYTHIRRGALFPASESVVSVFQVDLPEGLRVGYVMGSGDDGPDAIRQMGAQVELLAPEAVRAGGFGGFDVLVLGIRAYETRPDLVAANDRVLEFARRGGTVIVQYNQYEFPQSGFAPFPVEMSRPHDRVSDETAPVRILEPDHPVFRSPNSIGPEDFDDWVQERGLYFLSEWSPEFTPLMEMADPGEDPKRGGLLVARVGEGVYVYTGLAFFRQFPKGVSGAYRLFANLLSLGGDDLPSGVQE